METLELMPFEAQHKIFKRLAEIADSKTLTKEEQEKYDNSMMVMWDNYAALEHAVNKGIKEGMEKGMKEGLEKGMEKGMEKVMEKGLKEGEKKKSLEVAKKLLTYNTPLDIITNSTGLSIEEIKKLKS